MGRDGGRLCTVMPGEHQFRRAWGAVGASCGCREEWRGCWRVSREEQKTSLSSSHPRPRERSFSLTPCSHGGHRPPDVCWTEHTVPTQPRLDHQVTGLVRGGFPLPCFHALPWLCCQHAWLGMLLPGAAGAELAPGEKKKAALAIEGNITIKWHICLRGHSALCPQGPGGSLGSPPGKHLCSPGHGRIPTAAPMGTIPAPLLPEASMAA